MALVEKAKYDLTAVIQERTVYTILEQNSRVDLRNRSAYAVPRRTVLHYHLGQWQQTIRYIFRRKYVLVERRWDVVETVAYSSCTAGGETCCECEEEKLFVWAMG